MNVKEFAQDRMEILKTIYTNLNRVRRHQLIDRTLYKSISIIEKGREIYAYRFNSDIKLHWDITKYGVGIIITGDIEDCKRGVYNFNLDFSIPLDGISLKPPFVFNLWYECERIMGFNLEINKEGGTKVVGVIKDMEITPVKEEFLTELFLSIMNGLFRFNWSKYLEEHEQVYADCKSIIDKYFVPMTEERIVRYLEKEYEPSNKNVNVYNMYGKTFLSYYKKTDNGKYIRLVASFEYYRVHIGISMANSLEDLMNKLPDEPLSLEMDMGINLSAYKYDHGLFVWFDVDFKDVIEMNRNDDNVTNWLPDLLEEFSKAINLPNIERGVDNE